MGESASFQRRDLIADAVEEESDESAVDRKPDVSLGALTACEDSSAIHSSNRSSNSHSASFGNLAGAAQLQRRVKGPPGLACSPKFNL